MSFWQDASSELLLLFILLVFFYSGTSILWYRLYFCICFFHFLLFFIFFCFFMYFCTVSTTVTRPSLNFFWFVDIA